MATPTPPHDDPALSGPDPREAWTPGDNDDEADEGTVGYIPWRFREGEGTPVNIHRVARRHPWANAEALPVDTPPLTWRDRWHHARLRLWWQDHHDRWLGHWEARRQRHHQRPSQRAVTEWLDHYQGLYRGHESPPDVYVRLLKRNGVPDWPNPYPPGDTGYYDFHPDGLLAADLEAILLGVKQDWALVPERDATVEHHRQMARVRWALVVSRPDSLERIARHLHVTNLRLATLDAALSPSLNEVGVTAEQVHAGAVARGWQGHDPEQAALQKMIRDLTDQI